MGACHRTQSLPCVSELEANLRARKVNKPHKYGCLTLYIKGAPERVLKKCTSYMKEDGSLAPIDDDFRKQYDEAYNVSYLVGFRSSPST